MDFETMSTDQRIEFVRNEVAKYQGGERLERAKEQKAYYDTENPAIEQRRKMYASAKESTEPAAPGATTIQAVARENKFASNEKVASSFFRDITDAKVQYLAGEGADVTAVADDDADAVKEITGALGNQLQRVEQSCLTDALIYKSAFSYMQIIGGAFKFQHVPFCEVIPYYDRIGQLENVMRYYKQGGKEFADYHTSAKIYSFSRDPNGKDGKGWKFDGETWQIITAVKYGDSVEETGGKGWPSLPWFEMQHNNDKTSSLTNAAKSMIRCYDVTVSDFANNLIDIQDVFINIKDSYGSGMEFGETIEMLKTFKVSEGIESVTTFEVPYQARQTLLNLMKQDIYASLRGVDVGRISSGQLTNTAIRALYSDIDLWADQAEWHLSDWLRAILEMAAGYMGVELPPVNINITRRAIFDEVEKMNALAAQKGVISDKTLYENHPLVTNAQDELERVAEQDLDAAYSNGMEIA